MKRRDFLKVLGIGVTVPLYPKILLGAEKLSRLKTAHLTTDNMIIVGGYDLLQDYYWLRVSVKYQGIERHDLMRTTTNPHENDFKMLTEHQNSIFKENGVNYLITNKQIKKAFEQSVYRS